MVKCFRPDHPFFNPLFRRANELNLPIIFHTGDGFSSPGLISGIPRKYRRLPIISSHLREGALKMMEQFNNFYVETSGTLPDFIERAVEIDEDRILFGSDAPYYRYATQIAIINASEITRKKQSKKCSTKTLKTCSRKTE